MGSLPLSPARFKKTGALLVACLLQALLCVIGTQPLTMPPAHSFQQVLHPALQHYPTPWLSASALSLGVFPTPETPPHPTWGLGEKGQAGLWLQVKEVAGAVFSESRDLPGQG